MNFRRWLGERIQFAKTKLDRMGHVPKFATLLFIFTVVGAIYFGSGESIAVNPTIEPAAVDTFIPAGYVLVPIELENQSALEGIVGNTAMVNLFPSGGSPHGPRKPVARHVRLIRAPLNPSQFAVLVPDDSAADLVRHEGLFFAMIENPRSGKTQTTTNKTRHSRSRIEYATYD